MEDNDIFKYIKAGKKKPGQINQQLSSADLSKNATPKKKTQKPQENLYIDLDEESKHEDDKSEDSSSSEESEFEVRIMEKETIKKQNATKAPLKQVDNTQKEIKPMP